eukprot:3439103-Pyramimonas_sp.AAC.2
MMSVHGVKATLAAFEPDPPLVGFRKVTADFAAYWLPAGLILAVYAAVMYKSRMKVPALYTTSIIYINITSFYGSSCADNGKDAFNTPETLPLFSP